jgi:transcriptional regulator with XRE-family HTH domain
MENNKMGAFLQTLRKERGLTQLQLATEMNVTHQSVSKWENGDSLPDILMLSALAKFYHMSVDELLNGEHKVDVIKKGNRTSNPFLISRLITSIIILLSLFLSYISETGRLGDYLPLDQYDPWNMKDSTITTDIRGFNLIFNANSLNIYTGGAWLIFLALIGLLGIFATGVYVLYIKHQDFLFIKTDVYKKIKLIFTVITLLGFLILLTGAIFNSMGEISINMGLFVGLFFTLGLFGIDLLENKSSNYKNGIHD